MREGPRGPLALLEGCPRLQYLWLATERNYFCVKEQLSWPKSMFGGLTLHEMHVDELREVAPGLWFPMKLTVVDYDAQAMRQTKKQVVGRRFEMTVEKVDLAPHHDAAFFRDVTIPTDLPVFTIKDRALVGSAFPEPVGGDREKAKLAEVVARSPSRRNATAISKSRPASIYKSLNSDILMEGLITEQSQEEHSILRGPLAHFTSRGSIRTLGGQRSENDRVEAFDGEWTRTFINRSRMARDAQISASLRKGGMEQGRGASRWHSGVSAPRLDAARRLDLRPAGRPARLSLARQDQQISLAVPLLRRGGGRRPSRASSFGATSWSDREIKPSSSVVLFLAADRNYIPIKLEHYGGNFGYRPCRAA